MRCNAPLHIHVRYPTQLNSRNVLLVRCSQLEYSYPWILLCRFSAKHLSNLFQNLVVIKCWLVRYFSNPMSMSVNKLKVVNKVELLTFRTASLLWGFFSIKADSSLNLNIRRACAYSEYLGILYYFATSFSSTQQSPSHKCPGVLLGPLIRSVPKKLRTKQPLSTFSSCYKFRASESSPVRCEGLCNSLE